MRLESRGSDPVLALQQPEPEALDPSASRATAVLGFEEPPQVVSRPALDDALRGEAEAADRAYARAGEHLAIDPAMFRRYACPSELWDWRQLGAMMLGELRGAELLDLGCGAGEASLYLAKLGAQVTAIDISDIGIACVKKRAAYHRVPIRALQMRCDPTRFPDRSFDLVHGMGILYRAGVDATLAEARRLLRPGGVGVFLEPLGDDTLVETALDLAHRAARLVGRRPAAPPRRDRALTTQEIDRACEQFSRAELYPYHLASRLERYLPPHWHELVRRADCALLSIAPGLRRYAGAVVIRVVR